MHDPLAKKLACLDRLSPAEEGILRTIVAQVRIIEPRHDLVENGSRPSNSTILLDGFAGRYNLTDDGRRQITSIHVAGDFVDLHSFLLKTMDHGVTALTRCRVGLVPHAVLAQITETQPHLTRLLWLTTLIDGAIHREWLLTMSRLSALEQTAHLFCELYTRLSAVGLANAADRSILLPLTQGELGDVLGITTVHVNRVLQEMRARTLVVWNGGRLIIPNWDRLAEVGLFNPLYLHQHSEPR
ncbi:Crp/Fnr family transcriptional regulator [Methylobacterium nigriterrae]|uniref:Crp/Fnr family transcriptional regulator n=1 Tax=Methylobacterium nigriterrae TaxID=3127512 RepID=UPI003013718D